MEIIGGRYKKQTFKTNDKEMHFIKTLINQLEDYNYNIFKLNKISASKCNALGSIIGLMFNKGNIKQSKDKVPFAIISEEPIFLSNTVAYISKNNIKLVCSFINFLYDSRDGIEVV